jgi:large subunit ribosomal protein L29
MSIEAKDLRGNDAGELRRTVRNLEEDLFKHRLKKTTSQLENTMLIRHTRRDIARVNTVLAERLRANPAEVNMKAKAESADDESAPAAKPEKPAKASKEAAPKDAAKKAAKSAKKES